MLSDVLGVLIAFVSIILLLSMVVTGLVQATQSMLRLRGRNLQKGVATILKMRASTESGPKPEREVRQSAARILNADEIATIDKVEKPDSLPRRLLGPKVSWVEPDELAEAISDHIGPEARHAGAATSDPIQRDIERMEPAWSKRFAYFIRLITIGWAVVVAVVFQVSAPDLFSALSNDPARTQLIVDQRNEVLQEAAAALAEDEYDLVSDKALDKLAEKFPEYSDHIAEAGNAAPTKQQLLQQLQDVLPEDSKRTEIVLTYSRLIDELAQPTEAIPASRDSDPIARLAVFGIQFWKYGKSFYLTDDGRLHFGAIIGVLLTAILLSFGAPFWFERLRDLAALRDLRAPQTTSVNSAAANESEPKKK